MPDPASNPTQNIPGVPYGMNMGGMTGGLAGNFNPNALIAGQPAAPPFSANLYTKRPAPNAPANVTTPGVYTPEPGTAGGGDPKAGAPFDPEKYVAGLTAGQIYGPQDAQYAKVLADYIKGLPIGQAEQVMKGLESQKGGLQGTPLATALYQALSGSGAPGTTAATSQAGFDPLGLSKAFSTTIPQWLSKQEAGTEALNKAGDAQMQQALQGASPQIQAAYKAIMPGMETAQADESRTMADLALTTPMFNELVSGIQAMNTAYGQAKAAATNEPYVAATVQGTGMPGTGTPANALLQGLQGPGIPAGGTTAAPGAGGTSPLAGAGAAPAVTNPNAMLAYYLQLAQGGGG